MIPSPTCLVWLPTILVPLLCSLPARTRCAHICRPAPTFCKTLASRTATLCAVRAWCQQPTRTRPSRLPGAFAARLLHAGPSALARPTCALRVDEGTENESSGDSDRTRAVEIVKGQGRELTGQAHEQATTFPMHPPHRAEDGTTCLQCRPQGAPHRRR
jgi:hypothetical protein